MNRPTTNVYMCFLSADGDDFSKLAYASTDEKDFLAHAGRECYKLCQQHGNPAGAYLAFASFRSVDGDDWAAEVKSLGMCAVSSKGELFGYIGQGQYDSKPIDLKSFKKYVRARI